MLGSGLFPSGVHDVKRSPVVVVMAFYYAQVDLYDVMAVALSSNDPKKVYDALAKEKSMFMKKHEDDEFDRQLKRLDEMQDFISNIGSLGVRSDSR